MIAYRFRARGGESMSVLETPRAGVLIEAVQLTDAEQEHLTKSHSLDNGVLSDARDFFETPRFEYENGTAYFLTRYPARIEGEVTTSPILIAVGNDFVLTVFQDRAEWFEKFISGPEVFTTQKTKLFLQLLREIEKEYTRVFFQVRRDVQQNRARIREVSERGIEELVQIEYTINEFVSALIPTNVALQQIIAGKHLQLYEEDLDFVEDVQLANNQLIENGKNVLKTIQNIRGAHTTLVSTRLNKVVRRLTALTILLTIPTIVASLFGMNVVLPLGDHPKAFLAIIAFIAAVVAVVTFLFARNRWL